MEQVINSILQQMQPILSSSQLKALAGALRSALTPQCNDDSKLLPLFLTAKKVEGCSPRTIAYYESVISGMSKTVAKPYTQIDSDDLRQYLYEYGLNKGAGKVTIDNIRRILSSFYSWLENEDYIVKSPVRRIRRVKTATLTKGVLSDEDLETLRDACSTKRDLAIVDMLATTGMRVGELVRLNVSDINLLERECIVTGKGNKQRPVYFDARAKLHLQAYINSRSDDCPALFVSLSGAASRMSIGAVESRLRALGKRCGIEKVHPHKFRRTLATHAIDKGMPIEQVQKLLGHARIDTTMHYAMVNQNNVKASHRKYLE
ncbi:site-specific tyrosine recombinase/integron integrase [Collinsella ihumii]|uniref:site-specific tyrosine recombinase/integron integrase n=1 Tax=Collinsella ihumii TaxID=1720204 RepID=UPI0025AA5CD7|nr:site-specific tyrosine recombinase/integron integrase [Collinsella ihumii]MDN0055601.1 tyrosine-type recombinase/integrase [Collinsella ihumii]